MHTDNVEPAEPCSRRQILRLSLCTGAGAALWTLGLAGSLASARAARPTLTLYDRRFPQARSHALLLSLGGRLEAISGDPTALELRFGAAASPAVSVLQGVTAESIVFCMRQLRPRSALSLARLDRDLFRWTLALS